MKPFAIRIDDAVIWNEKPVNGWMNINVAFVLDEPLRSGRRRMTARLGFDGERWAYNHALNALEERRPGLAAAALEAILRLKTEARQ